MPDSLPDPAFAAERVLILDFGSQVTQLIARRLRESGVYCEIWPFTADESRFRAFNPRGIILSGSPASVLEAGSPRAPTTGTVPGRHREPGASPPPENTQARALRRQARARRVGKQADGSAKFE